jgi:flagellum-specific peptidoglycan hydrolase FlgJ
MSFFKDMISNPVSIVSPVIGGVLGRGKRKRRQEEEAAMNRSNMLNQERISLLEEGMAQGREKAKSLTGMESAEVGQETRDIYDQRKAMTAGPSRASAEIRRGGQNTARRQRMAGASEAQQRQTQIDTSRAAGMQADLDYERRLAQQQDLLGSILKTQSSLEPAYGQLQLSTQYIAPEQRKQGLVGDLLGGLGLF